MGIVLLIIGFMLIIGMNKWRNFILYNLILQSKFNSKVEVVNPNLILSIESRILNREFSQWVSFGNA